VESGIHKMRLFAPPAIATEECPRDVKKPAESGLNNDRLHGQREGCAATAISL